MRTVTLLLALAAVAALPTAMGMEHVVLAVPEASVHVEGTEVKADQVESPAPVGVKGGVEVQDVDVRMGESKCVLATKPKDASAAAEACQAGQVETNADDGDLVTYDIDLLLAEDAAAPAAEPQGAATVRERLADAPAAQTALVAAAAAGASAAALYAAWRVLKWTGLAAFLPLYSHITDDHILDDANRAGIYRLIREEPGISTKDIADRLGLAWGTVTHHLGKLEKRRFVVSKKYGKYRRYFANGAGGSQDKDALAVLRLDRTGDVAALIQRHPGVSQKAVSEMLGVSSSTILWHVKRLEEVHLVRKVRDGKLVRYYPDEGMQGVAVIPAAAPLTAA